MQSPRAVIDRLQRVLSNDAAVLTDSCAPIILKDWQKQSLEHALIHKNLIISVPTGSGKSLVYTYLPLTFELYNNDSFENYNAF